MADQHAEGKPVNKKIVYSGLFLIAGLIALIGLIQSTASYTDHQLSNIATATLGGVAFVLFLAWWMYVFQGNWLAWLLPIGFSALVGISLMLFEFSSFSGELVPRFRYRFETQRQFQTAEEQRDDVTIEQTGLVVNESSFPGFLGSQRNGFIEKRQFAKDWNQSPPKLVWKQASGSGLAGFATAQLQQGQDNVMRIGVTLEQRGRKEAIVCYDLETAKLLWMHQHQAYHTHPLGDTGPRSTPMISDSGLVYAQGATGHVWCVDAVRGTKVWEQDLFRLAGINQEQAETAVTWGRSASPLLVDDKVVLPLGGVYSPDAPSPRTLVALDAQTGEPQWYGGDFQISYASPVLGTLCGRQQIVTVNEGFVSGHDPSTGETLWSAEWPGSSAGGANCSNPTLVDDDKVLLSKGYGGGAKLIKVAEKDGQYETENVWNNSRVLKTKFTNPVVHNGFAYGLSDGTLECVSLADGSSRWKQPRSARFGHGHILIVEDVILGSTEDGEIVLVDLNSDKYKELGRFSAVEGKTWNPMALLGSNLLVRNGEEMAMWELPARND